MKDLHIPRLASVLFAIVLALAACGSDSADTTAVESETPVAEEPAEAESDSPAVEDGGVSIEDAAIPEGAEIDDRTEEEIIQDNLDGILIRLSVEVEDLDDISECIIDRLEGEGIAVTGQGAAEIVALVGCEPDIIGNILGINPAVADEATRSCALGAIGAWFSEIPLLEAEVVLQAPEPPQSVRDQIVSDCDVDDATAQAILG